jgi:hypothetical protein
MRNSILSRRARVFYVPTPKVAYTTMLWVLSRIEGDPEQRVECSDRLQPNRAQTIHDSAVHRLPHLGSVSPDVARVVLADARWMRVGFTREPYGRLASGWANRILLQPPDHPGACFDEHDAQGVLDLRRSFRRFVLDLAQPNSPWMDDRHFSPQVASLVPGVVPYTHLVDLASLREVLSVILERAGAPATSAPLHNAGIPIDHRLLFDPETAAIVDELYEPDFERLGYQRVAFAEPRQDARLDPNATALLQLLRDAHLRIRDLSRIARARRGSRYAVAVMRNSMVARLRASIRQALRK